MENSEIYEETLRVNEIKFDPNHKIYFAFINAIEDISNGSESSINELFQPLSIPKEKDKENIFKLLLAKEEEMKKLQHIIRGLKKNKLKLLFDLALILINLGLFCNLLAYCTKKT